MSVINFKKFLFPLILLVISSVTFGQGNVPFGINYQAVARDNTGKELANKNIDIRFSIISDNPLGTVVYQELHSGVITSKYGVFSLVIGGGIPTGGIYGELSEVKWSGAFHYLKVEVKFESSFIDMGTMQFLAVPYALYAQKALEPGPQGQQGVQGPKGDPGDPASDKQTLSFDGSNLSISIGNGGTPSTVNLSTLNIPHQLSILGDTLSIMGGNKVSLPDQIQDLSLGLDNKLVISKSTLPGIDMTRFLDDKQQLIFNSVENTLNITNGTAPVNLSKYDQTLNFNESSNELTISGGAPPVDLTSLKNDADADPANEIQDIQLVGNKLTITNKTSPTEINLVPYLDNTDNQTLTYNSNSYNLSISGGNNVSLGSLIAFRVKKTISLVASPLTDVTFIPESIQGIDEYNDGSAFNRATGEFVAPETGIYCFNVSYLADGTGGSRKLSIYYKSVLYEDIAIEIAAGSIIPTRSITMKINSGEIVKLVINTGTSTQTGTGSFSGYRVY